MYSYIYDNKHDKKKKKNKRKWTFTILFPREKHSFKITFSSLKQPQKCTLLLCKTYT